jgi:CHAT domain-containing protein
MGIMSEVPSESSRDEALDAATALPNPSNTLLLGRAATEAAFKEWINHRIIHLAVHAIANEASPDKAALILLSDPQNGEDIRVVQQRSVLG